MKATTALPFTGLDEDHRSYLEERGLTADMIKRGGFYSARPGDLSRLAGRLVPDGTSGLVIPYSNTPDFCRVRLFPPIPTADGKKQKFGQPQGTGVRAYVPSSISIHEIFSDPEHSLTITEGEIKALALTQAGWRCIGLGGVWNFRSKELPREEMIRDLEQITWKGRIIYLAPDSDAWTNEQVLLAVFTLGRLLENRGGTVLALRLPTLQGQEKTGADDYLAHKGPVDFRKLVEKATTLRDRAFKPFREREKHQAKQAQEPPPDALALLEHFEQVRRVHPAQDFIEGVLAYGIPIADSLLFVTSERKLLRVDELPDNLSVHNRGFDLCRFSREGVVAFLSGATVSGHHLLMELREFFSRFIKFRDPRHAFLLATWTMGTYVYRVVRVFPYLAFRSPVKRCGKSRALDVLSLVCFNASPRTTSPTEAQLFRGPAKNGGTLLLDEVEGQRGDKDTYKDLLAVLNSGFESGGVVTRLLKTRHGDYEEISFPTYAPRGLAGISRLAETLEDRAILLFMARKLREEKVERFSPSRLQTEAQALRDKCYTWALIRSADLAEVYDAGIFPILEGLDDRARDLWEPLISIALLADAEAVADGGKPEFANELAALALDLAGVRDEGDSVTAKLIETLLATVKMHGREAFTPTELFIHLKGRGFDWIKSTRSLAGLLNPLGFVSTPDKVQIEGRWKSARLYHLRKQDLNDLYHRYCASEDSSRGQESSRKGDSCNDNDRDPENE